MDIAVSPQELQDIVDRYGEDPAAWPSSYRLSAQELIDDCAEARGIIEQAKRLRCALRDMGPDAPDCFSDRIVALALELDPPMDDVVWFRSPVN
ncbi:hypothetical protein [Telmatospirillum sp.]|uniref:hypothetical protein n=1 Tax=Telmatospirillum sp. TaxID=2079197 RepID=UPI002841BE72|nr:hypothetical protein [Telmatospirillum sp.]MDR3440804.1 hypothetical protein [Telmatospirillum sp.]